MLKIVLPHYAVNFVWFTDPHLSDKAPGRRRDDYRNAILGKMEFVRQLTEKLKGVALCGGDVFHVKNPKSPANSLGLLVSVLRLLRRFPLGGVFGIPGNHDISFDRMDSLPHQPLGILVETGVYKNIASESILFTNQDESVKVLVEGYDYAEGEETLKRLLASGPRPEGVNYRIGIVHAYGCPGGPAQLFGARKIGYDELADIDYDFLLWGHDHSRIDTQTVGNVTHVNLGSLARAAFNSDEVDRPVVAAILSFAEDGVRMKEKEVPVKPLEIAFTSADKGVANVGKLDEVTEFFSEMDEAVEGIETSDPREAARELCGDNHALFTLLCDLCEF